MEFLVVSDSKLKIMMNRDDMQKYEIDGDNIDYDNPKIRRSFWRILDAAREKCGFEAAGDKVLIQFYPFIIFSSSIFNVKDVNTTPKTFLT